MVAKPIGKRRRRSALLLPILFISLLVCSNFYEDLSAAKRSADYDESRIIHKSSCPVKVFVHDLGFKNETSLESGKGFGAKVEHGADISYYTTNFGSMEHGTFILQKFMQYSHCTVSNAVDADFIILPMANYDSGRLENIVQSLERDHNATLFRRGMKDHIIPGLQNTRKSYLMARALSTRSHELAFPMVKFVVDIWGWWYHFSTYRNPPTEEGFFMYYDRIMSVPYAASVFNFTGDATLKRPYLASFVGNTVYPEYRKEIADQCRKAMQTNGDCFLGATDRSKALKSSHQLYVNSTFFFCPAGDSGPRKALFDGLAANSIPVIFDETSFDLQYPYYFGPNPRDYSIFMNSTVDMMGQLRAIPPSRIVELQTNINSIRASIAYLPSRQEKDASWKILTQLEEYKNNNYSFPDRWANISEYKCLERKCRFA